MTRTRSDSDQRDRARALELVTARDPQHFAAGERLFREYAHAIGVDLCFQGFEQELARIAEIYSEGRRGLLLLALPLEGVPLDGRDAAQLDVDAIAACGALRALDERRCEMKRLYVRPAARGSGVGRRLAERLVEAASALGYDEMLLDTLETMHAARGLYRALGFIEVEPYYDNPLEGVIYLRLPL